MRLTITVCFILTLSIGNVYAQGASIKASGGIIIGNVDSSPEDGTLRWTGTDVEVWNGTDWISLTGGQTATVEDVEGNVYKTVQIGDQVWMAENLRTPRYSNGELITLTQSDANWNDAYFGAYCWYDNNDANDARYGKLYNWLAVADSRGLCPTGWHVPTHSEWGDLVDFLGGEDVAGGKLKEVAYWGDPNFGATNESGFRGLPGGRRFDEGAFILLGTSGYWWSSSDVNLENALRFWLTANLTSSQMWGSEDKRFGYSVRCLKD